MVILISFFFTLNDAIWKLSYQLDLDGIDCKLSFSSLDQNFFLIILFAYTRIL